MVAPPPLRPLVQLLSRNPLFLCAALLFALSCSTPSSPADLVAGSETEQEAADKVEHRETLCNDPDTPGATSRCLQPTKSPEYYIVQGLKYFDTLDIDAPHDSVPNYSLLVARWEWPPWLLLTGFGKADMIEVSLGLKELDPSTVPVRDCRYFPVQPFARCYVEFEYENGPCPICEEFTFNDQGEMTFIEAWSNLPGLVPTAPEDPWAEALDFPRLSTKIPGLGNGTGLIDLDSQWMQAASLADADVADFALRASDWWKYWFEALAAAEEGFFATGCGW